MYMNQNMTVKLIMFLRVLVMKAEFAEEIEMI